MIGLIMGAVGAAAGLASQLIPNKEITTEYKTYTPDPMSVRNAGLFNTSVNLGGRTHINTTSEAPGIKKGLGIASSLLGVGGTLMEGLGVGEPTGEVL